MQIIAEKRVLEVSEQNIETTTSVFTVESGETVEALLVRVGLNGSAKWHYDLIEVRLKLVTPNLSTQR
jgi:hypothetical protein